MKPDHSLTPPVHIPHIKFVAASAATPSRTPHPAPRNLGMGYTGPCRGEAKTRIPYVSQSPVTTKPALSISIPIDALKNPISYEMGF